MGADMRIVISANAGPHYALRGFSTPELCSCMLAERRQAEQQGTIDFSARLAVQLAGGQATTSLGVERGPVYRVERIDFYGNRHYSDVTLRRNLLLHEGVWLDQQLLRLSLVRLNRTRLFENL